MEGVRIRPCEPAESGEWAEFLNRNFGYEAPQSYAVDFAPLFSEEAMSLSRVAVKDGEIIASATLYPVTAIGPSVRHRIGIIGAVATDAGFRGQGLSKQLLNELEAEARLMELSGLVLWSDQHEFYAKAGYVAAGHQTIFSLEDLPRPPRLVPGTPVYGWDWEQVRSLYERHTMRVERTDAHWKALEQITSCTRVQWMDDEGRVLAYIGFDRGHDLQSIVHEWGGDADALYCLVWTVLQGRPSLFWLTHPRMGDPISPLLGDPEVAGSLMLFKAIDGKIDASGFDNVWFWGLDSL